jgi:toxin-antitoxin system PIN domain toxin
VVVPDVNLLLYAHLSGFRQHRAAKKWWETLLAGREEVGIASPALFGFVRLATNRRVFDPPMEVDGALERVETWFSRPQVRFLLPGPRHLEIASRLLRALGAAGNLTTDAQLAALAIENQADLHSNDSDFARFPDLRWVDPLK